MTWAVSAAAASMGLNAASESIITAAIRKHKMPFFFMSFSFFGVFSNCRGVFSLCEETPAALGNGGLAVYAQRMTVG